MRSQSSDSQDEGFYKPSIQITQPTPAIPTQFTSIQSQLQDEAIDIINEDRPTDFRPRFLNSETVYYQNPLFLHNFDRSAAGELMNPIVYNKNNAKQTKTVKQKRYQSLALKYKKNEQYQLIYSKLPPNSQFSSYYFSLQNTPDYNPNDFSPIVAQPSQTQMIFDSRFENGNLMYAYKKRNSQHPEYDLIMQNDTNTKGYNQWFYFSVRNEGQKKIKVNIVNFIKKNLMFLQGVRPVGFSTKAYEKTGSQWTFIGDDIKYGKSYITRQIIANPIQYKNYYTLSFNINFQYEYDTLYVALNFPYTYTRMNNHLNSLLQLSYPNIKLSKKILCHSLANNPIPYLVIQHENIRNNKTIVCMARQHPGESVGSFVLEQFMNQILKKPEICALYKFVIIPMVNPDGVIYGNFRTNLAGFDLNRQWSQANRWLHPEVFFVSRLINSIEDISFVMDFHGHSKKLNSFIYSCVEEKIADFRLYPYIFSQYCNLFSLKDCTYSITADKTKTARVNVYNKISKPFVFTLQTSFFGHSKDNKAQRFTLDDFKVIGKGAFDSLHALLTDKKQVAKYEAEVKDKSYLFDQWASQNREDDGSESNPSQDELNQIERKLKVMSDAKVKKTLKRRNSKGKKKKQKIPLKKKKQYYQFLLKKSENSIIIQTKKSERKIDIVLNQKPIQAKSAIVFQEPKKLKIETKKQIPQTNIQPKIKVQPPVIQIPRSVQIKTMGPNAVKPEEQKMRVTSSNLFDTSNYFRLRDQISYELKRDGEPKFEISAQGGKDQMKKDREETPSRLIQLRAEKMKKQIEEKFPVYNQPKKKSREKIYIIKENKVINSITRVNEEEVRKNIERQVSHRTMALRNYQKIMSNYELEKPRSVDRAEFMSQEDPYKTRKLLKPIDLPLEIRRHRNFKSYKEQQKGGVFFSFLGN